jgi:hypothetical protein
MNSIRHISVLLAIAVATCAIAPLAAADAAKPPAWELWPYQVQVLVAVERSGQTPAFERDLAPWLKAKVAAAVGGMWRLEVSPARADLRQKILTELDSLTAVHVSEEPKGADKLIFVGVSSTADRWQIRAREFDATTGLWNSTISRDVRQSGLLRHETFAAVMAAFAPHARIEQADGENVTLRLRASGLAPGGQVPLAVGTVFRPVLVASDARGAVTRGKAELIDWTYLTPTEKPGPRIKCRMQTALSGKIIPDYHPQRQRWAVAVTPSTASTRLRLVTRGSEAEPIEGCDVVALELPPGGGTPQEVALGRSDRRGEAVLSPGSQLVRMIEVRRGDEVLARVPIAVGVTSETTLPLEFDRRRLPLETALAQLADDLVDLATRREVLSARIRAAEQGGKADDAATLRQQLREIGGADSLLARLDKLQQSVQAASPQTQQRLQEKVAALRKAIEQLKAPPAAK